MCPWGKGRPGRVPRHLDIWVFRVRPTDQVGNTSEEATGSWTVVSEVTFSCPKAKVSRKSVFVTSRVKVSGAGKIAQRATTGKGKKSRTWCRASKTVAAAGTHTIQCNLRSKGRKALRKGALKLTLRTTFSPSVGKAVSADRKLTVKRRR